MFHKYIKLVIAVGLLVWAIFQFIQENIMNGISIVFLSLIVIFFYYKNEFLLLAFFKIRKEDFEGVKKWLGYIKTPSRVLRKPQEAYFYFLHGIMYSQTDTKNAEKFLRKALSTGLSMNHDIAMAKLNLAGIAMNKRRKREATHLINEAKKLDKHGMLKEQIIMMKQQLRRI